jgi:hypothetical protein
VESGGVFQHQRSYRDIRTYFPDINKRHLPEPKGSIFKEFLTMNLYMLRRIPELKGSIFKESSRMNLYVEANEFMNDKKLTAEYLKFPPTARLVLCRR